MPVMNDDEPQLIERAKRGNLDAFNILVQRYQDGVFTLTYRLLGDSARAADAAQDAFIQAYRRLDSYRGGSFKAWLFRIATNRSYDDLRKQQRHPTMSIEQPGDDGEVEPLEIADSGDSPEGIALQRELQRAIQACINALSPEQKLILVLSDIEELPYEIIAEQTNTKAGTVKSRLSRARASVRDCLQAAKELLPDAFRLKG
jgi:RNA polymerase sigma-70 factor (ECF subfamily)